MDMFYQGDSGNSMAPSPLPPTPRASLNYEEVVKELIHDEKQYQRDLHMIIRVFREELVKIVKDPKVSYRQNMTTFFVLPLNFDCIPNYNF